MSTDIRKHIIRETAIATLFNMAFSFGFTYALFGGLEQISNDKLILDALPQSFFVTFFGVFIPTLLTRKKLRAGKLGSLPVRKSRLPKNPFLRAITMGVMAAIGGYVVHLAVLGSLQVEQLAWGSVIVYKVVYGAVLTWIVTPIGLRIALSESA